MPAANFALALTFPAWSKVHHHCTFPTLPSTPAIHLSEQLYNVFVNETRWITSTTSTQHCCCRSVAMLFKHVLFKHMLFKHTLFTCIETPWHPLHGGIQRLRYARLRTPGSQTAVDIPP